MKVPIGRVGRYAVPTGMQSPAAMLLIDAVAASSVPCDGWEIKISVQRHGIADS